jgi:hypothetical protein
MRSARDEAAGEPLRAEHLSRAQVLEACALPHHGRVHACAPAPGAEAPPPRLLGRRLPTGPFAARGVLLDLARRGRRPLPAGTVVTPLDLDECAELQGVTVEPGDALLLRTGADEAGSDAPTPRGPRAGLDPGCGRWLRERGVVLVGGDAPAVEARLGLVDPAADALCAELDACGVLRARDLCLGPLAADCAATRDFAFLLVVPAPDALGVTRPVALV